MDDSAELRAIADKCRRLAKAICDGPARQSLLDLAADYEQRAMGQASQGPFQIPSSNAQPG